MIISGVSDEPPSELQTDCWYVRLGFYLGYSGYQIFNIGAPLLGFRNPVVEFSSDGDVGVFCA